MKTIARFEKWIALGGGVLAAALRQWTLSVGEDSRGLYPAAHGGWIGYLIACLCALLLFLTLSRQPLAEAAPCRRCPPVGHILVGIGLALYGFNALYGGETAAQIVAVACFAAAILLIVAVFKPILPYAYGGASVLFLLLLFQTNLVYGGEPEMLRFLPQVFACLSAAFAAYRFWGTAVDQPDEGKLRFWQCLGGFLCIAAAPGNHLMYALAGLWILAGPLYRPSPAPISDETAPSADE